MQYMPINIDALSRLKKRLPEKHPKYVEVCQDLYNASIRFGEEERVYQILNSIPSPNSYAVFQNLYADSQTSSIQIDCLIATPSYFLILEVKCWTSILDFKDSPLNVNQTTSTDTKSHVDPCFQAELVRNGLISWLNKNKIDIPVFHAVIFPEASTIINKSPLLTNFIVASELPILLKEYEKLPQVLSNDLFQEIISTLQLQNPPITLKPLCQKYSIRPTVLKKGLFCSDCHFHLLKKSSRMYYCPNCMNMPDNPFADAMTDWFFLVGPSITNGELKSFTNSTTSTTVGYFMKSSGFVKTGNTRDSVYRFELET